MPTPRARASPTFTLHLALTSLPSEQWVGCTVPDMPAHVLRATRTPAPAINSTIQAHTGTLTRFVSLTRSQRAQFGVVGLPGVAESAPKRGSSTRSAGPHISAPSGPLRRRSPATQGKLPTCYRCATRAAVKLVSPLFGRPRCEIFPPRGIRPRPRVVAAEYASVSREARAPPCTTAVICVHDSGIRQRDRAQRSTRRHAVGAVPASRRLPCCSDCQPISPSDSRRRRAHDASARWVPSTFAAVHVSETVAEGTNLAAGCVHTSKPREGETQVIIEAVRGHE